MFPDWELEAAALNGLSLEFSLVKGPRRLELDISRGRADRIKLSMRGPSGELSEGEAALIEAADAAVSAASFTGLLLRLGRDSLLYSDARGGSGQSRFERYYRVVDHSPDYWKFFYPQARFLEQEIGFGLRYAKISHATLECRLNNPLLTVNSLRFFAGDARPPSEEDGSSYSDTMITEADVLSGRTQEILGRELERVAREEQPAFIHLKTTCLPELVGDNPTPFIERLKNESGVPVLWTSKTRDPGTMYETMVERMLAEVDFASKRDSRAVLLAGIPTPEAGREAAELLKGLGLRVVGTLFPRVDFKGLPDMPTAGAVVWLNPVGWEKIDDGMFLRRGLAVVRYHPPYGLAGVRAWLGRIASVLELGDGHEAAEPARDACGTGIDDLRAQCRRRTVALIGDPSDVESLVSTGRALGFSVAGLLCELGFQVRCLVWNADGASRTLRRPKTKNGEGTIEFVPFSTRAGLDRELGRGVDLVFSHFNHDPRLEAHGLFGFTERVFELGLEGMIRTGKRLLERCAARPFPRHRAYLTPWT